MSEFNLRSNAEILDVLYAVALGEGFMWGMSGIRDDVVSGMVLQSHETAQTLCRILLGFVIIILSWLYYRRFMLTRAHYPAAEFVTDVVVMMTYMSLFLLIDVPGPFYATVAAIWVLYGLARAGTWLRSRAYLGFLVAYVVFFAALAASTRAFPGTAAEWLRLLTAAIAAFAFRPLDHRLAARVRPDIFAAVDPD
jgi:hypothetical protein